MRILHTAIASMLLTCLLGAQDLRSFERELRDRYVGKTINIAQPYQGKNLVYDKSGRLETAAVPACGSGRATVDAVHLSPDELVLDIARDPNSRVLIQRSSVDPAPIRPVSKREHQAIHFRSGGKPWDRAEMLAAIEALQHPPAVTFSKPPGAQPPPVMGDRRILYLLPDGPVYGAGDGVTTPHATYMPDPEYTEEARKLKACASLEIKAVVEEDGGVAYVRTQNPPIGFGFDEQSAEAISKWKFEPGRLDGKPVKVEIQVTTTFRLY